MRVFGSARPVSGRDDRNGATLVQLQVFDPGRAYGEQAPSSDNLPGATHGDTRDGGPTVPVRPLAGRRAVAKRAEDLVLASLPLVLLSSVMLVAAVLVASTSRGPVMLRQRRFGYGDVPFMIFKFRTMYDDKGDRTGARATVPGDQRVTRVGRFLRASSIDELPQLFNVLKGEMSLVGPRPHPVEMRVLGVYYYDAVPGYRDRHRMKPGITGLAQVNGYRGLVDTLEKAEGRLAWDLAYVERWSLGMDIRILGRTLVKGFFGPGAF